MAITLAQTATISREHTLLTSPSGLMTITGGKWTTYRKMAEEVVDRAEKLATLARRPCGTHDLPLHGATVQPDEDPALALYGSRATELRALCLSDPRLSELINPRLPYRRGEVVWQVRNEMAMQVEDVLARRTRALFLDATASAEAAEDVARLMANELGKDETWVRTQTQEYRNLAQAYW